MRGWRTISGIVHVLKSGSRWVDAPSTCGSRETLYSRSIRWAGIWQNIFYPLASVSGSPAQVLINSSTVKAHRGAVGGKGRRRLVARLAGLPRRSTP